jgi:hypothetical protein
LTEHVPSFPYTQDINKALDEIEAEREAEAEARANYNPLEDATLDELDEFEVS